MGVQQQLTDDSGRNVLLRPVFTAYREMIQMIFREYQTADSDVEIFEFDEDGFGGLRATLTRKHGQKRIDARFIDVESGGEVARMFFTDYFEAATAAKCFVYGIRSAARIEETRRELEKMGAMCRII